ncbi:MAG TPA: glycoside hydrolase family 2 TIM barrel-domain containing protein, partial [Ruminiclostridium sp.]|nr:glycoside hydrolase family 2 TIM barrel-domain containing protein [Ruminiclostridium sp.]
MPQYIFDDFNGAFLAEKLWNFMNMGSPGNLKYILQGDGFIILEEKNLNHDGHGLVSKAYLDSNYSTISAGIAGYEYGAGIGYYGGDGCWDKYITFAVLEGNLEVKVSSGAQNGDAFMHDGQEKYYYFYKSETVVSLPIELKIERQGNLYKFYCNGQFITACSYKGIAGDARAIVKSMGSNTFGDTLPPSEARIDFVRLEGLAPAGRVTGTILNEKGIGIGGAGVHIAGHEQFFVTADKDGRYAIENIPRGRIRLVAAAEKYLFNNIEINTEAEKENFCDIILEKESEENIPRPEYNRPDFNRSDVWSNLNGTWSFDFDSADTGEAEEWFAPGKHQFSKCIKVPFSWSSLEGFGEEFYVDGKTLHEANPYFCNYEITGENGWYKKSITVPVDFPPDRNIILKIGACSAVTKVWCDGQLAGIGIDQYGQLEFGLGRLEPGTEHVLVIKVQYPYDKNVANLGKQLFWFNQCPGIWQTVWLEPRNDFYIKTIHATPLLEFSEGRCLNAAVEVEVTCENAHCGTVYPIEAAKHIGLGLEKNVSYYSGKGYISNWSDKNQFVEFNANAQCNGLYQLAIRYSAGAGDTERLISINGNTAVEKLKFPCTPGWDAWQYTKIIVKLDSGLNLLRLFIAPEADSISSVNIDSMSMALLPANGKVTVSLSDCTGKHIAEKRGILELTPGGNSLGKKFAIPIPDPKLWDTENPNLYYLNTHFEDDLSGQGIKDSVKTYFGLRKIEADWAPGHSPSETDDKQEQYKYLYLNGKPFYMLGILDQGYNPWGIYTYRAYGTDTLRGSIKFDINHAKSFGYNTIRMHIKENEPLWYYYCDVAGIVVWNEHPSNEFAVPDNPVWDGMYRRQLANMLDRTYNNPSIVMFSTINESWGIEGCQLSSPWKNPFRQQWQKSMALLAKYIDETRLICDNSGFGKTGATD